MDNISTPLSIRTFFFLAGFITLLLYGLPINLPAQCNTIDQVSFIPADTTLCGYPANIDFQSTISVDSTPVLLDTETAPPGFTSAFSFSFPTENNGCYYYLEIEGYFTLWSNTNHFFDAYGKFNINNNQLISQGVTDKLSITPPLFISPNTYSTSHVYRYYYQGDGSNITVDFDDDQLFDNSGNMTFSWHVVPCFSTLWEFGDGATATEPNTSHTYTAPGTYPVTLTVTDELNDCSEAFNGLVNIFPLEETNLSATICAGDTYTLGSNNYSETGIYSETFTSYLGCDSTVILDLLVFEPKDISWEATPPTCQNPNGTITVSVDSGGEPPFLFSIDGGSQFQQESTFTDLDEGSYSIVVQDVAGCETEPEPVFLEAVTPITVEIDAEAFIVAGASYPLEAGVNLSADQIDSIQWTPSESLSCSDCLDPIASPASTTEYLIEVWDVNGCYASAITLLSVEASILSAPNAFTPDGDGINDKFILLSPPGVVANIRSFSVFSRWGQAVFQRSNFLPNDPNFAWDGYFKGERMTADVYAWFAEVEFSNGKMEVLKGEVTLLQ